MTSASGVNGLFTLFPAGAFQRHSAQNACFVRGSPQAGYPGPLAIGRNSEVATSKCRAEAVSGFSRNLFGVPHFVPVAVDSWADNSHTSCLFATRLLRQAQRVLRTAAESPTSTVLSGAPQHDGGAHESGISDFRALTTQTKPKAVASEILIEIGAAAAVLSSHINQTPGPSAPMVLMYKNPHPNLDAVSTHPAKRSTDGPFTDANGYRCAQHYNARVLFSTCATGCGRLEARKKDL
ncbi:hypothetical protein C8R43DRAFT_1114492 [Mycena crocata]|nr:hypothetical protein C8R43DRAFT_1114492 [Mycena crocata]